MLLFYAHFSAFVAYSIFTFRDVFLGAFADLLKVTNSFVMFVCPSVCMEQP